MSRANSPKRTLGRRIRYDEDMTTYRVAITGASGAIFGLELVSQLLNHGKAVHLLISDCGRQVLNYELGLKWPDEPAALLQAARTYFEAGDELTYSAPDNFFSAAASGSSGHAALVICPCSMGTLGRIANGVSHNLIERAADVALKEKQPLILAARETPLSAIHLENMLKLSRAGADIVPPMPAFYNHPQSIDDLVRHFVGRILDRLGIDNDLVHRWGADGSQDL